MLILCMSWGIYSLKLTPKDGFLFSETFHGSFIYPQSFCQKSTERKSHVWRLIRRRSHINQSKSICMNIKLRPKCCFQIFITSFYSTKSSENRFLCFFCVCVCFCFYWKSLKIVNNQILWWIKTIILTIVYRWSFTTVA